MPNETLIPLLISVSAALLGLIGSIIAVSRTRATGREANDIDRFEALLGGYERRIDSLEKQVKDLETKDKERDTQLRRIKDVIQKWIMNVYAAWPGTKRDFPWASEEDLALLEITIPK